MLRAKRTAQSTSGRIMFWAVSALLLVSAWLVLTSPALSVRQVLVYGQRRVSVVEIREHAGLLPGTPLIRVNLRSLAARVKSHPQMAQAWVQRRWPDAIIIRVEEREPVALVARYGGWYLVDGSGYLLGEAKVDDLSILPIISGVSADGETLGEPMRIPQIEAALDALAACTPAWRGMLSEVNVAEGLELTLYLPNLRILLGQADSGLGDRVAMLEGILRDIGPIPPPRRLIIDCRYGRTPVVRPG